MIVSKYFIWFILFSFMGWIYETIYCTVTKHKWQNRGFLFGPICPIYGVGAVAVSIICSGSTLPKMPNWKIFVICFFGSIVLEYVTSYVLEKLFHAIWWDYSGVFGNIHGRVCFPASIGFGVAGLIVVHFILPFTQNMTSFLSPLAMEVIALLLMGVVAADTALTVSALTCLTQNLQSIEQQVNKQMEQVYANLEDNLNEKKLVAMERKDELTASAAEKKEELTNRAMETMTRLMNLGQRHALHSVKEFHYDEHTSKLSSSLLKMEKELKQKAAAVKNAATEKAVAVKNVATEKATVVKNAATEKAVVVKEKLTEAKTENSGDKNEEV